LFQQVVFKYKKTKHTNLYSGDAWFEPQSGHWLSWLKSCVVWLRSSSRMPVLYILHSDCDNFLPSTFKFFVVLLIPLFDAT